MNNTVVSSQHSVVGSLRMKRGNGESGNRGRKTELVLSPFLPLSVSPSLLRCWLLATGYWLLVPFFLLVPTVALAQSIAEILKSPTDFEQKQVSVVGEAANVVTRYGDNPYTTFDLLDANDRTIPVFTWGIPEACRQGDTCRCV